MQSNYSVHRALTGYRLINKTGAEHCCMHCVMANITVKWRRPLRGQSNCERHDTQRGGRGGKGKERVGEDFRAGCLSILQIFLEECGELQLRNQVEPGAAHVVSDAQTTQLQQRARRCCRIDIKTCKYILINVWQVKKHCNATYVHYHDNNSSQHLEENHSQRRS